MNNNITFESIKKNSRWPDTWNDVSLFRSALRLELADQIMGLLSNKPMKAREIRPLLDIQVCPQQLTATLNQLFRNKFIWREEVQDEPIKIDGKWIIPSVFQYTIR